MRADADDGAGDGRAAQQQLAARAERQAVDDRHRPERVRQHVHAAPGALGETVPQHRGDDDGDEDVEGERAEADPERLVARREGQDRRDEVDRHVRLGDRGRDVRDEEDARCPSESQRCSAMTIVADSPRGAPPAGRDEAEHDDDGEQHDADDAGGARDVPEQLVHQAALAGLVGPAGRRDDVTVDASRAAPGRRARRASPARRRRARRRPSRRRSPRGTWRRRTRPATRPTRAMRPVRGSTMWWRGPSSVCQTRSCVDDVAMA